MKIKTVRIYRIACGRLHPVIVEIETDDGITGIGEAGIAYGLGATAVAGMLKDIAERMLMGCDPFRIEALWLEMYDHTFWAKGGDPIVCAAISAIEIALWDIKGKALGVPAYELLGGKIRDDVRVYANGWGQDAATVIDFADVGERTVALGYDALKCYPFAYREAHANATSRHPSMRTLSREALNLGYEKIKALRSAIGPDIDIMLDLSGGISCDETIRFCREVEQFGIYFIEEPADPFDTGALKKISDSLNAPIAAGERLYTRYAFRSLLESHSIDIAQPDICLTGGLMETKKIAAYAESYDIRVQPHVCGSPIATAAALQIDACISNFAIQEIYPFWSWHEGFFEFTDNPPEESVRAGRLAVSDRPGIGIGLLSDRIASFLWEQIRV